jgi:cytochrome oxidase assembly protein ShyY1
VYRFLFTRQWVILTLLGLVMIPAMIELGFWQLHRHEHKVAQNAQIARALSADPLPVERLTAPGRTVPASDTWHPVTATGRYDSAHEVVVRRRVAADDQSIGFYVETPFVLADGRTVLVNRGWVAAADDQAAYPDVPAAPAGEITITGRLMPDETTAASGIKDLKGLPDRQVMLINSTARAATLGRSVVGGYIELTAPAPAGGRPELVPAPDHSSIGPHMAYAVQWWLFAAGVPVGWVVLVRRERAERRAAEADSDAGSASADAGSGGAGADAGADADAVSAGVSAGPAV